MWSCRYFGSGWLFWNEEKEKEEKEALWYGGSRGCSSSMWLCDRLSWCNNFFTDLADAIMNGCQ